MIRVAITVVCAVAAWSALAAAPASAGSSTVPAPPGTNDFTCRPTAAHPRPVILLHGLSAGQSATFTVTAPLLKARGYCVYALNYGLNPLVPGVGGLAPVEESAAQLGAFVDRVLASTGAAKVDLVGASEGTFMPQYWLKRLGGAPKVQEYVAFNPLYDGTEFKGFRVLAPVCGACPQIESGSPMVELLKAGGIAAPGVHYTAILSRYDEFVLPFTSGRIDEPGQDTVVLQDVCPLNLSEHTTTVADPDALRIMLNALDPSRAGPLTCIGARPLPARQPSVVEVVTDAVARLQAPSSIRMATLRRRGLRVRITSLQAGRARVTLSRARRPLAARRVTVPAGRTATLRIRSRLTARLRRQRTIRIALKVTLPGGRVLRRDVRVRR